METLYKYKFAEDSWARYALTSSSEMPHGSCKKRPIAIDYDTQKIFISHQPGSVAIFSINDNSKDQAKIEIINPLHGI